VMFRRNGLKLPIWFSLAVIFVGVMLAGVGISGCKKAKSDPFPVSGVVAGWEKTSDTRTFAAKDLYQYIDGDAEQYIAAGVVTTSTSDYKFQGSWKPRWTFTPWAMPRVRPRSFKPAPAMTRRQSRSATQPWLTAKASSFVKVSTWFASSHFNPRPARRTHCRRLLAE